MNPLESKSIEIIREAVATARNPLMMYSIGKDSSVMLHLARKAFYPAPQPFPLLHIVTGWKFRDIYAHRTRMLANSGMHLISHTNPDGLSAGVGPFTHVGFHHTDVMKTDAAQAGAGFKWHCRGVWRCPASRRKVPCQRAGVQLSRPGPPLGPESAAARVLEPLQHVHCAR